MEKFKSALQTLSSGREYSYSELGISKGSVEEFKSYSERVGLNLRLIGNRMQIPGGLDLLDRDKVLKLVPAHIKKHVNLMAPLWSIDSTNTFLLNASARESIHGVICWAESQSAGKGRRGRRWVSPFAKNIYMSYGWRVDTRQRAIDGLSLCTGVAVVRALEACGVGGLKLKWPNDVIANTGKIAGILIEIGQFQAGIAQIVIGIGINLALSAKDAIDIDQPWSDIERHSTRKLSRNQLLAELLEAIATMLLAFETEGFLCCQAAWQELDAYKNQQIELIQGSKRHVGENLGVDPHGNIKMKVNGEIRSFNAGEVSLRPVL